MTAPEQRRPETRSSAERAARVEPAHERRRPYREGVALSETPILAELITELAEARRAAEEHAVAVRNVLADLEALHEPDAYGECPTCQSYAPCPSLLVLRGEVTLDDAFTAVRDNQPPIGVPESEAATPAVPSLQEMLAAPAPMIDRVFDRLIGRSSSGGADCGS